MSLIDKVYPKYNVMSIIGMSKNAGKTFTLNHLIDEMDMRGVSIGITSIGRDGERIDVVTDTDKPTIFLPQGNYVATTKKLLELSEATVSIEEITPFDTPLGEVIIGKVIYDGHVQISGPQTLKETKMVSDRMLELGAEFSIIDGALDRKSSAAPEITQATILASGASFDRSMDRVVEETAHIAKLFTLPTVEKYRAEIEGLLQEKTYATIDKEGNIHRLDLATGLGAGRKLADAVGEDTEYLVFPGALTSSVAEDFLRFSPYGKDIRVIVADATKVFIEAKPYKRLLRRGLYIELLHHSELVAITLNPYAPEGYQFDGKAFKEAMVEKIPNVEIVDLMMGG
ncbi:hypothetical protein LQU94_05835 [Peptoniphilus sp. KCTC 25270]|uniref:lysine 5,6-aminomutase reactivase subunit KamB n=1 Tax=Peptoniphilus sp. KCTC 25270 TaxID=2897414 RepID=UPI001E57C4DA|nr:hypothetical protein [Peptoniphilus sp. KCTC 25270]MCD1147632.1 hypothetical protein [Peptoniphilus sp. KCTC 25270]